MLFRPLKLFTIFSFAALLLCIAGFVAPCTNAAENDAPMMLPTDKAPLIFLTDKGYKAFDVEIARTETEREQGLMHRRIFPKNRAMLFVFNPEQMVTMWMENTPLPLDMVFADSRGKIIYVYEGAEPYSRNLISSLHPVSYVVELNAGTVKADDIKVGQRIRHPVICGECKN